MGCPPDIDWIRLVGRELREAERSALEAHLATCEACAQLVAAQRAVWGALGEAPEDDAWCDIADRINASLDAPAASHTPVALRSRWWLKPLRTAAGLALAVGVGVSAGVLTSPRHAEPPPGIGPADPTEPFELEWLLAESATGLQALVDDGFELTDDEP